MELKSKYSYDYRGASWVTGISTIKENHFLTVLQMINASGSKFTVMIIFIETNINFT